MTIAILFGSLILFLIMALPVGAAILLSGLVTILLTAPNIPITLVAQKFLYGCDSISLIAIPLFMLAGNIMNSSGITRRLLNLSNALVGHFPGGLSHVNILASMFFAGMSGSAVADCSSLGTVLIPAMIEEGYEPEFAAAVTASSSTVGPIIPPSIGAVILGIAANLPVGKILLAAAIPGICMTFYMLVASFYISKKRGYPVHSKASFKQIIKSFSEAFLALITPLLILCSIVFGIATATEAAVFAVFYSLFLGLFVYRTITIKDLVRIITGTSKTTASLMFVSGAASLFAWLIAWCGAQETIVSWSKWLSSVTSPFVVMIALNVFLFIMGCFIAVIPNILIWGPTYISVATALGYNPLHAAVILLVNLHIGLVTPPVGMAMYLVCQIAKVPIDKFVKANAPFLLMLILVLLTVILFPQLTTWLPNLLM